jgi:hypothetical protein
MQGEYVLNTLHYAHRNMFEARASEDPKLIVRAILYR